MHFVMTFTCVLMKGMRASWCFICLVRWELASWGGQVWDKGFEKIALSNIQKIPNKTMSYPESSLATEQYNSQ